MPTKRFLHCHSPDDSIKSSLYVRYVEQIWIFTYSYNILLGTDEHPITEAFFRPIFDALTQISHGIYQKNRSEIELQWRRLVHLVTSRRMMKRSVRPELKPVNYFYVCPNRVVVQRRDSGVASAFLQERMTCTLFC